MLKLVYAKKAISIQFLTIHNIGKQDMPTMSNYLNLFLVTFGFIVQIGLIYYFLTIQQINANKAENRCNPLMMLFSDTPTQDFQQCVMNSQMNYAGYMLQPFSYLITNLTQMSGELGDNMNALRGSLAFTRGFVGDIVQNTFSTFMNLIVEFQVVTASFVDSIGKVLGIVVSLIYVLDGSQKTMTSMYKGPIFGAVRTLSSCFHPHTLIKMQNGEIKKMCDVKVGEILDGGSEVFSTMTILPNEPLFVIKNGGIDGENVYVTGSHFIKWEGKFIQVKNCPIAESQTDVSCNEYCCFITKNRTIKINELLFWDWEDDCCV